MASGKQSSYDKVKYTPLDARDYDTDEEGEKLEFNKGHVTGNTLTKDIVSDVSSELEANGIHLEKAKILNDTTTVRVLKRTVWSRSRNLFIIGTLLVCVAAAGFFFFVFPKITTTTVTVKHYKKTPDWSKLFDGLSTETSVHLVDVDEDGRDDIILSMVNNTRVSDNMDDNREDIIKYCRRIGAGDYCLGKVIALRGYDGYLLWEIPTFGHVFVVNCEHIDVDMDGKLDCIMTGRFSQFIAIDPRKGSVLWRADTSLLSTTWNIYNPLVIPDITGDGVKDIVIAHGGDPKFPAELRTASSRRKPKVHVRYPGKLVLFDGSTGQPLGKNTLEMIDQQGDKETYMSPVLHTTADGSLYVLYGIGGETVSGSFHAISLPDLYKIVVGKDLKIGPGKYKDWPELTRSKEGIITIYRSATQGVMVPPILADMNGDGVKDILMMAYDSTVTLFDGQTMKVIWTQTSIKGYETYSSPTPGYFTDDSTLDFMIHFNKGAWPEYNFSMTVILDGSSGDIIWKINTTQWEMSSDIVVKTTQPNRDAFIFKMQGRPLDGQKIMRRSAREFRRHGEPPSGRIPHHQNGPMSGQPGLSGARGREGGSLPGTNSRWKQQGGSGRGGTPNEYPDYSSNYGQYYPQYNSAGYDYSNQYDNHGNQKYTGNSGNHDDINHSGGNQGSGNQGSGNQGNDNHDSPIVNDGSDNKNVPEYIDPNYDCNSDSLGRGKDRTEIFIMDRSVWDKPIQIFVNPAEKIYYNLTDSDRQEIVRMNAEIERKYAPHDRKRRHGDKLPKNPVGLNEVLMKPFTGDMCMVRYTTEKSTGALGDLDGDGELDLVFFFDLEAIKHDEKASYFKTLHSVRVVKFNLKDALASGISVDLHPKVRQVVTSAKADTDIKSVTFRKKSEQVWGSYLGSYSDSVYHTTKDI